MGSSTLVDELKATLNGAEIVTPDSPTYTGSIARWSDTAIKQAAVVVYPRNTTEVSQTVKLSTAHSTPLVVAGGRHSTGGDSSITSGLVIDLSRMRAVTVDAAAKTITAQGGCTWQDVDEGAAAHGLATVGGTVNHTGVGGLTLGGGYGFLSGLHGLAVDNLLAVEIVLADGAVARASDAEHADLFWAVRGAGAAFGCVTAFTFRAHELPARRVFMGVLAWPLAFAPKVIEFANGVARDDDDGKTVVHVMLISPPDLGGQVAVSATVFHAAPEAEAREKLKPLLESDPRPLLDLTQERPYEEVNGVLAASTPHGGRKSIKGATFGRPLRVEKFEKTAKVYEGMIKEVPSAARSMVAFEFMNPGKVCERRVEEMAMPHRSARLQGAILTLWEGEDNDLVVREWARKIAAVMSEPGEEDVGRENFEYVNYDGTDSGPEKVYGPNYGRLIELKAKYDPQNVFKKNIDIKAAV